MNRDVSAKPSLLAYATAAKTFDEAKFLGSLDFDDPNLRGLLFDTPDGEAAVMWSRADGYILNADHDPAGRYFPAPEVWVDPWPTKTALTVVTSGDSARQVDSIGQTTAQAVNARATTIVLDAAQLLRAQDHRQHRCRKGRSDHGAPAIKPRRASGIHRLKQHRASGGSEISPGRDDA